MRGSASGALTAALLASACGATRWEDAGSVRVEAVGVGSGESTGDDREAGGVLSRSDEEAPFVVTRSAFRMGTLVRFSVATHDGRAAEAGIERALGAMDRAIEVLSEWEAESDVSQVNANAGVGAIEVDRALIDVLAVARAVSEASGGAFDVTWVPLGRIWCLDGSCALPPAPEQVEAMRALVDWRAVVVDPESSTVFLARTGMAMGLGGIAKGHIAELAAASLRESGFGDFVIDAGGDVVAGGVGPEGPWRVGVAHPRDRGDLLDTVELRDAAMVGSGDYERFVEVDGRRYHHILDPRTGYPSTEVVSATVIAPDATLADGLATALVVLGVSDGIELIASFDGVQALVVDLDLDVWATPGWPGSMAGSAGRTGGSGSD